MTKPELAVRSVPVQDLRLDPGNARRHGRRNLDAIKGSLSSFGQRRPLVVLPDLTVIAGNGTLEAMRELGWTEVAVTVVPEDWSADQARAYALADNRTAELAEWDDAVLGQTLSELVAEGWDLASMGFDGLPALETDSGDDEIPEAPEADAITKPGAVWVLGDHRLGCGSSTDSALVARVMAGATVDAIVTDPPYGVAYESRGRNKAHKAIANDAAPDDELRLLVRDALGSGLEHCGPGAPVYVFHADSKRDVFESAMLAAGCVVHQTLIWVKDRLVLSRMDYQPQHEPCLYGWKPGKRHAWFGGRKRTAIIGDQQPDFEAMDRDQLLQIVQALYDDSTVIRHDRPSRSDDHPTMKPVGLLSRLIVNSTKPGQIVYDPFLGSGSTLIAAERQNRVCYGVELEPSYCDVIVRRWEALTGQKATLEHGEG